MMSLSLSLFLCNHAVSLNDESLEFQLLFYLQMGWALMLGIFFTDFINLEFFNDIFQFNSHSATI